MAEYSLGTTNLPIGISEYRIGQSLPAALAENLPGIDQIKAILSE